MRQPIIYVLRTATPQSQNASILQDTSGPVTALARLEAVHIPTDGIAQLWELDLNDMTLTLRYEKVRRPAPDPDTVSLVHVRRVA